MVGIFHAAGRCRRWFSCLLMHCVGFGEEIDLDWHIVENNIIPHTESFLRDRKIHSDPLAAVQDIKDPFDRHLRYLSEDDPMLVISAQAVFDIWINRQDCTTRTLWSLDRAVLLSTQYDEASVQTTYDAALKF
jgi:hypothetical protein